MNTKNRTLKAVARQEGSPQQPRKGATETLIRIQDLRDQVCLLCLSVMGLSVMAKGGGGVIGEEDLDPVLSLASDVHAAAQDLDILAGWLARTEKVTAPEEGDRTSAVA